MAGSDNEGGGMVWGDVGGSVNAQLKMTKGEYLLSGSSSQARMAYLAEKWAPYIDKEMWAPYITKPARRSGWYPSKPRGWRA